MALKRGPVISGQEAYTPAYVMPQMVGEVVTGDAGGADVSARLWFPNGADSGLVAVDQPLLIDWRMYFVYWDKAWTGGNVTIKPQINGALVNAGAQNLVIAPQGAAGYTYKPIAPGQAAIGHGDTSGFKLSCAAGFTCTGTLSFLILLAGAAGVQGHFASWTPS